MLDNGYQEMHHDPLNSEEFSLSKSDLHLQFSSYRRYGFNERNTRGKLFSSPFLTYLWSCLLLKEAQYHTGSYKIGFRQIG